MSEPSAQATTLTYATCPPNLRHLRRTAAWGVAVAILCAAFSVIKALAYGLLMLQARQTGAPADDASAAWPNWLAGGVAVELVAGAIALLWLAGVLRLRRRVGLTPTATDRLRSASLIVVVQLALLGYALLAGTHGIQLWGTGVCLLASALLTWRTSSAPSEPRAQASG